MTELVSPRRVLRKYVDGMTALMLLAIFVALLAGAAFGAALADNDRHDCNAHGGVWIAGAAHSRCIPEGSFTALMLGLTQ